MIFTKEIFECFTDRALGKVLLIGTGLYLDAKSRFPWPRNKRRAKELKRQNEIIKEVIRDRAA